MTVSGYQGPVHAAAMGVPVVSDALHLLSHGMTLPLIDEW
jgi:hypothetical protein